MLQTLNNKKKIKWRVTDLNRQEIHELYKMNGMLRRSDWY
jgi:hypothetical protein